MIRRPDRLVIALKSMPTSLDCHFPLGAAFNCERRLRTGLPVLSDLIRRTGSLSVPTLVIVPPDGPLTEARLPPLPVTTPKVRFP
jgi:hypothetical protein